MAQTILTLVLAVLALAFAVVALLIDWKTSRIDRHTSQLRMNTAQLNASTAADRQTLEKLWAHTAELHQARLEIAKRQALGDWGPYPDLVTSRRDHALPGLGGAAGGAGPGDRCSSSDPHSELWVEEQ